MNDRIPTAPISDLLEEIKGFEWTLFPPVDEVCSEHDKVLGQCPEELRRFYSFSRYCERELKQLQLEGQFSSEKDDSLEPRLLQWNMKYKMARTMLWFALWEYFNAYVSNCSINLAKDWSVVLTEDHGPDMPPHIRQILGGFFPPQR